MRSNNYLLEADRFYKKAVDEFNRAKLEKDDLLFRDAAEKACNAIVKATNYIIKKVEKIDVKSHRERTKKLFNIEQKNGKIRKYKFCKRFMASAYYLHQLCFYDGIYDIDLLEYEIKETGKYIKDVKKI